MSVQEYILDQFHQNLFIHGPENNAPLPVNAERLGLGFSVTNEKDTPNDPIIPSLVNQVVSACHLKANEFWDFSIGRYQEPGVATYHIHVYCVINENQLQEN